MTGAISSIVGSMFAMGYFFWGRITLATLLKFADPESLPWFPRPLRRLCQLSWSPKRARLVAVSGGWATVAAPSPTRSPRCSLSWTWSTRRRSFRSSCKGSLVFRICGVSPQRILWNVAVSRWSCRVVRCRQCRAVLALASCRRPRLPPIPPQIESFGRLPARPPAMPKHGYRHHLSW